MDHERVSDFEIVIGFASPIGTDLDTVIEQLADQLRVYGYDSQTIRLSHLLDVGDENRDSAGYYKLRMDKGDALREQYGSGDALAAIAITKMWNDRGSAKRDRRFAWMLRTLKHADEVALLRQTYGDRFVLIGVHQDLQKRIRNLAHQLRDEHPDGSSVSSEVSDLVRRDESDAENELGQHGQDVYAKADYFVDLGRDVAAEASRLVGLLFGVPFETPRRDEVCMFAASGVALRSADAGRQVGAVIATERGEILSAGCNEVPRAGGGEYWVGDDDDARDFKQGHDYNKKQIRRVLAELLNALSEGDLLAKELAGLTKDEQLSRVLGTELADIKSTRLMSLIEFGRIVHAEMAALMQAARLGAAVDGATLYTTAFPCHMCMRLIVSSGIRRVVYIDPYPKSLAMDMYGDSITEERESETKVSVQPFCGSAPSVYSRLFTADNRERKPDGTFEIYDKRVARMRLVGAEPLLNAEQLEAQVSLALSEGGDRT